ncbi:BET1-like protein isoform X2 [Mya arenaria]|uniref:BET1-like protein isoform X2 n=1 Tax=Mya arenaria TaxID=6604 RepID=UPI0022E5DE8E|nr:BET1-like protein isoform X2 [Mya arenaria]XP_052801657.1 BET1-like protein isoform X2 [Mya arenaria]
MADWGNRRNGTGRTEEMLDTENQARVEGLAGKISRLKGIALDIETETKSQNMYMDDHMSGEFDSSQGLLTGSMNRINSMVNSGRGNRKVMCYIIAGLVILFFISYYLVTKVTGG